MSTPQTRRKIYHITHVENLPSIVGGGGLLSDATMIACGGPAASVGMSSIKQMRLTLPVSCHPGTTVGQCVPFYFCPRSVMLYILHRGNHPGLHYRGGQAPLVHLEADLLNVVTWAELSRRRWCFSLSNASGRYAIFRSSLDHLDQVNWHAVESTDFQDSTIKEGKQAEFLVESSFPWSLVTRIGVYSQAIKTKVEAVLSSASHRPPVDILPNWYY